MRWLHFIWNGIQAYQEFWGRTEFKLSIQPPSTENLIIPKHDYTTGTRLISISSRKQIESISEHFLSLFTDYIVKTEEKFEGVFYNAERVIKIENETDKIRTILDEQYFYITNLLIKAAKSSFNLTEMNTSFIYVEI